jgi:hypothetical protein
MIGRMLGALLLWTLPYAAQAEPPWRIESFCHREVAADKRCLVRARQGIITWRIAEMPVAPAVDWTGGVAVLRFASKTPVTMFYAPPNRVAGPFRDVLAVDVAKERIVRRAGPKTVEVRGLFDHRMLVRTEFAAVPRIIDASFAGDMLVLRIRDANDRVVQHRVPMVAGSVL